MIAGRIIIDRINRALLLYFLSMIYCINIFGIRIFFHIIYIINIINYTWNRFWRFLQIFENHFLILILRLFYFWWRERVFNVMINFYALKLSLFEYSIFWCILNSCLDRWRFIKFIIILLKILTFQWWNVKVISGWVYEFYKWILFSTLSAWKRIAILRKWAARFWFFLALKVIVAFKILQFLLLARFLLYSFLL